ncbi:MAG: hypothetical protein ACP5OG_00785 [Candidatus Nanoarchaeia archaeon]
MNINNLPKIPSLEEIMRETGLNEIVTQDSLDFSNQETWISTPVMHYCPMLQKEEGEGSVVSTGERVSCDWHRINEDSNKKYSKCFLSNDGGACVYSTLPSLNEVKKGFNKKLNRPNLTINDLDILNSREYHCPLLKRKKGGEGSVVSTGERVSCSEHNIAISNKKYSQCCLNGGVQPCVYSTLPCFCDARK